MPTWQPRAAQGGLYSRQAEGAPRRREVLHPARGARRSAARRGRCSRLERRISGPGRVTGGGGRRGGQSARPEGVSTPRYEPRALGAWARFCTARRRPRFCAAGCGISDVSLCPGLRMEPPTPTGDNLHRRHGVLRMMGHVLVIVDHDHDDGLRKQRERGDTLASGAGYPPPSSGSKRRLRAETGYRLR